MKDVEEVVALPGTDIKQLHVVVGRTPTGAAVLTTEQTATLLDFLKTHRVQSSISRAGHDAPSFGRRLAERLDAQVHFALTGADGQRTVSRGG